MTQEEKAKAYDEALLRADEAVQKGCLDKDMFDIIFPPEESEDERIRKHLIAIVELYWGKTNDPDKAKELAYLEKQKENPKNADSISADCVSSAKCEDRSPKHTDSFGTDIRDTPAYWRGWDDAMKQKEQKPAEKQDYSGLTNLERTIHRGFLVAGVENVPITIIKETAKECLAQTNPIVAADAEQLLKILPQKPAWSEDDETAFGDLMWCIEQARKSAKDENDMGNIWSAENWVKNRLKSLRPSWKPSEEQLNALYRAAEHFQENHFVCTPLLTLYEQLKKL